MKTVISRKYRPNETTGKLIVFDQDIKVMELCTLELPDLGNQRFHSCIPEGIYQIEKVTNSHGNCFSVKDVPGRDGVLIHIGNYASGKKVDTEGCILPGLSFVDLNMDGNLDVSESTVAMFKLYHILPDVSTLIII
jgi:hypothetical protein